jgi:2-polyprenyl-3-methyl-5-hydroxy-6-metoxy-1,4-benzoquinol methylase
LPANANYFLHFKAPHTCFDPAEPIRMVHYHDSALSVLGLLQTTWKLNPGEKTAVDKANALIGRHFNNLLFWNLRYERFAERGSGVGSRGENAEMKRELLRKNGIEQAASVLDIGCGDLEVLKLLDLKNYLGLDQSKVAIETASRARPDWKFLLFKDGDDPGQIPPCQFVLCLEVLIHQKDAGGYYRAVKLAAGKCEGTLIISGYDTIDPAREANHMLAFHEPLSASLAATGRFRTIEIIGRHTDVTVFRCDR